MQANAVGSSKHPPRDLRLADSAPLPPALQWLPTPTSRTMSLTGLPLRSPPQHQQPPVLRLEATDMLSPPGALRCGRCLCHGSES